MRRPPALLGVAGAIVLALSLFIPGVAFGHGGGQWFKFLFTPQAGFNSAGLSCGWHSSGCVGPTPPPGPALDFPAASSDANDAVYFRSFGFKPSGGDEWVAWGTPFTFPDEYTTCKTTYVNIYDRDIDLLATMWYTHTYRTSSADMLMYVSQSGRPNQAVFAAMTKAPWDETVPESQREKWACYNADWWTGVHVHEYHASSENNVFLRDGGDCTAGDRYPCAPAGGGPYNPQNWGADWARIFCVDDTDCDGWTDDQENYIGTDPWDWCPDNPSDDAWPPDITNDASCDVSDVLQYLPHLNSMCGEGVYWNRLDLNVDCVVDVSDVLMLVPYLNTSCQ